MAGCGVAGRNGNIPFQPSLHFSCNYKKEKELNMRHSANESPAGGAVALSDIPTLRKRARKNIDEGAVTPGYAADRAAVVKLLNEALATELVCVLRYKRHFFMAKGIHSDPVKAEFTAHAAEEMAHADLLAKRIVELGGAPNFSPEGLSERSHAEYVEGEDLNDMIKEDLIAERIAIESYREMVAYLGDNDPTTQRMLKEILASEEEHADDLASLLEGLKH
jgi:bacterioferritin